MQALPPPPTPEVIIVTGTALPESRAEQAYAVERIGRRRIEQAPSHELDQLLKEAMRILNSYSILFRASSYSTQIVGYDDYRHVLEAIRSILRRHEEYIKEKFSKTGNVITEGFFGTDGGILVLKDKYRERHCPLYQDNIAMHGPAITLDIGCRSGGLISTYTYQVL